ncbi:MAG: VOC family protein [Deinococcota bacterium]
MALTDDFPCTGLVMFLPTDNLDAVSNFYETLLGLPLVRDQGLCRIFQTAPGAYIGFCNREYTIPTDYRVVITLLIDDVDGAYKVLKSQGIETENSPELSEQFNVYQFFVRDPNGYLVEVQRFNEPLPS